MKQRVQIQLSGGNDFFNMIWVIIRVALVKYRCRYHASTRFKIHRIKLADFYHATRIRFVEFGANQKHDR